MRLCIPWVEGRGAGLGNELIPWARAHLIAQLLNARTLAPAFGLNPRRYARHFGTPRADWLLHRALKATMPVVEFDEAAYRRFGAGDVMTAARRFIEAQHLEQRQHLLVLTRGMWGGYGHVAAARDFVRSTLFTSRFAARNLAAIRTRLNGQVPVVGMHVRLGDFKAARPVDPSSYRGQFNVALPLDWYVAIARALTQRLAGRVQFLVASDGTLADLQPLRDAGPCVTTMDLPDGDCSDLLALADCDLLVCSVSSYSAWAAYLSDAPYLWYQPQLQSHPEGFASIWGHEATQQAEQSDTRQAMRAWQGGAPLVPRGHAVPADGALPEAVVDELLHRWWRRQREADLIQYGVVPMPVLPHANAAGEGGR